MAEYYRYLLKNSPLDRINTVSSGQFSTTEYGEINKQYYPFTSSIAIEFYPDTNDVSSSQYTNYDTDRKRLKVFKPLFKKYKKYSQAFNYPSEYVDFESGNICLISIPSIFYGESISKGTVKLSIFKDGILLSKIEDIAKNGELIKTTGSVDLENNRNIAGIVLYDEGLIALFDNTPLDETYTEQFYSQTDPTEPDYPKWINWGLSANLSSSAVVTSSYDIEFDGVHQIPQLTMLAHAERGEFNNSTNYTFIESQQQQEKRYSVTDKIVTEKSDIAIKNITKNKYITPVADFHKETYITKINLYDKDKNLIGVAKLATPVRKSETREFTFKLKLDL